MVEDLEVVPLQYKMREYLFLEWTELLKYYKDYMTYKGVHVEKDKTFAGCVAFIRALYKNLRNYGTIEDLKDDKIESVEELNRVMDQLSLMLFNLGITDARIEIPSEEEVLEW